MLSETDLHLVVGWLYAAHEGRQVPVVLGERVRDVTTGEDRDVDIVYAMTEDLGLAGVEVKGEKRPLDTPLVEQICQKLTDMPSLARRCLVSASGFTQPALRKADAHGLECVRFVRGRLRRLGIVDLAHIQVLAVTHTRWLDHTVEISPAQQLSAERRERALANSLPLRYGSGATDAPGTRPRTMQELADLVAQKVTGSVFPEAEGQFEQRVAIDDAPTIEIDGVVILLNEAIFRATVRLETTRCSLEDCGFLEMLDGTPFAAAVVIPTETGLVGLYVSAGHQQVRLVHIPIAIRQRRPLKLVLQPQS